MTFAKDVRNQSHEEESRIKCYFREKCLFCVTLRVKIKIKIDYL